MKQSRIFSLSIVCGIATAAVLGFVPGAAAASSSPEGLTGTSTVVAPTTTYRQLLGTVDRSTYLEASTPASGKYYIEYEITGTAYFGTYVNDVELGYAGGPSGTYRTRSLQLNAGGQLVHVVGPTGAGTARVFIVQGS